MKAINWKLWNLALWLEIALSLVLPFRVADPGQYQVGVPFWFLKVYDKGLGVNPLMSMYLNPLLLLMDLCVLCAVLLGIQKGVQAWKSRHAKPSEAR